MAQPVSAATAMPLLQLYAIVLPSPGAVPPMMLRLLGVLTRMPSPPFGTGLVPLASVPMRLPWMIVPEAPSAS